jgi:hypothetical protein
MTKEDATKMLQEVAKELKKTDYKGMLEKAIKNHLDPKASKGKLAFDQACTSMIEQKVIDKISYKGWENFKSTSIDYIVESNLGVDAVFMKSCANVTDKSKLTITSGTDSEKTCKSFVLGINKDKSNGIFCFEPKDPYDGEGKFVGRLRAAAAADKMFTPQYSENKALALHVQQIQLARQATRDGMVFGDSGVRKIVRSGSFDIVAGSQITAGFRFGVGSDGENLFSGQDIGINFKFVPEEDIMETRGEVLVGGKYTSCAMAAKLIVRVIKNSVEIIVQAITQPNRKGDRAKEEARILAENAAKALATAAANKAAADAALKAFQDAQKKKADEDAAQAAQAALAAANALIDAANKAKIDSDNLKNGNGGTILKADIPAEADTTHGQVIRDITEAKDKLINGDLEGAVEGAKAAKDGSVDLNIAAKEINKAAVSLDKAVTEIVDKAQDASDKDLLDLNYVAFGKLPGVAQYLNQNIPDILKKLEDVNGETLGEAVTKLIIPLLTPEQKPPPETVVEKSNLDPSGTVPAIKTVPGNSRGGEVKAQEQTYETVVNKDLGASSGTLGGNGLTTPPELPVEGGKDGFQLIRGEGEVGFSMQAFSGDKYIEPKNQEQLQEKAQQ